MTTDEPVGAQVETKVTNGNGNGWGMREAATLLAAVVLLGIPFYHGSPSFLPMQWRFYWWVGLNFACLFVVPVAIVTLVWRQRLSDYGLGLGDSRVWLKYLAVFGGVMAVVMVAASRLPSLQAFYPRYPWARSSMTALVASEAAWLVYFLAWEFFFRGFLLNAMLRRFTPALAIAIQTVPFVLMHFPKPEVEAAASVVAGVALGIMSWRGRSMVGTWLLHWGCAALLDVLVVCWPLR
jgi:membrane protease YdiL (CAAX protease family)